MLNQLSKTFIASVLLLTTATVSYAGTNKTLMAKGQWKDPKTGLIWQRCSIGQKWNGRNCTGKAVKMTGYDAIKYFKYYNRQSPLAGKTNWRLPTISELSTLRNCSKGWSRRGGEMVGNLVVNRGDISIETVPDGYGGSKNIPSMCDLDSRTPTFNSHVFNSLLYRSGEAYWSSSTYAKNGDHGLWLVEFYGGSLGWDRKESGQFVLAVRSE